jgi:hypothetical protein
MNRAIPEPVRRYVRLLQNPYALLSLVDESEDEQAAVPTMEQKRAYLRRLQNPHAQSEIFGEELELESTVVRSGRIILPPNIEQASKKHFENECRRIFLQYVPSTEARVLRQHQREFITRNSGRTAEHRGRILHELAKYDISTSGNFRPEFNREREVFTVQKLNRIEKAAQTPPPSS